MRKQIALTALILFTASSVFAQNTFPTTGNVGIGTANPENIDGWNKVLEVHGTQHAKSIVSSANIITGMWSHDFGYYGAPAGGLTGTYSNHPFSIITNKDAKMTVLPNGNVGIGTTNPDNVQGWQRVLELHATDHAKLLVTSNTIKTGIFSDHTWGSQIMGRIGTESSHDLGLMAGYGNVVMTLKNTGHVGIGTSNPENVDGWDRVLEVHGAQHAKSIVSSANVITGSWSHEFGYYGAPAGGLTGTYSNHPFSIITNKDAKMTVLTNGNVGIGTITPRATFDVGTRSSTGTLSSVFARIEEGDVNGDGTFLGVRTYSSQPVGAKSFALEHSFYGQINSSINFYRGQDRLGGEISFNTYSNVERMRIDASGNVGIGTSTPKEKLSVNGNIRAKEVKVETSNWPDYVFEEGYQKETLSDLERYIKANKHLPGIADAKTIAENGISISETIKAQQKIIEELTLHLIEQGKEIAELKKQVHKK